MAISTKKLTSISDFNYTHLVGGISSDGRFILFLSEADDVVSGDSNGRDDLFLYDHKTTTITNITLGEAFASERGLNIRHDGQLALSADGSTVVFMNEDSTLPDPVYTWDRGTGVLLTHSVEIDPVKGKTEPIKGGNWVSVDRTGNLVAFDSVYDYDMETTGYKTDSFVYTVSAGGVTGYAKDSSGKLDGSQSPSISENGEVLVYRANDGTGWRAAEVASGNSVQITPILDSYKQMQIDVSADGDFILYRSDLGTIAAGDNNTHHDVFLFERKSGKTFLVSKNDAGEAGNAPSGQAQVSGDGDIIVFVSTASNLVANDNTPGQGIYLHRRSTGKTTLVSKDYASISGLRLSADGRYLAFQASQANVFSPVQVYRMDLGSSRFTPNDDNVSLEDTGEDVDALAGNDVVNGGAARDTIRGAAGDDTLKGGGGNDVLLGGSGKDRLFGGSSLASPVKLAVLKDVKSLSHKPIIVSVFT